MFAKRYFLWVIGAVAVWLFVIGCYTQLYRPTVNGTPEAISSETLYDRYDSSAIDTTLKKTESYPSASSDYYDRWDYWGRSRPMTRWGFDFNNYYPPYYWGYYGWEDYYGNPWWYSGYYDYWWGYPTGSGAPSEPASKRPYGRDPNTGGNSGGSAPAVQPPPSPPPSYANPQNNPSSTPSRPSRDDGKKADKQRDFGRKRR
jgi:hypothetical protein